MPSINYGAGAYKRDKGSFPPLRLVNMFLEKAKTSENQIALLSREGLSESYVIGVGPVNGLFCQAGAFGGDIFGISGETLYRGTDDLGNLVGSAQPQFAATGSELLVTRSATLYSYNGTNLADSGFAGVDSNNVTSTRCIGNFFIALESGSGRFFWSSPLDGRTWDSLDFATAETAPDNLLDCAVVGDNLWLFGETSVEPWTLTGAADLPFTRIEQVSFDKGILATGCVVNADNTLFFIGSTASVYRLGQVPERISDHWLEERILSSSTARMFTYSYQGHEIVTIRLDSETYAYDCATGEWFELESAQGAWLPLSATMSGTEAYFGHGATGQVMAFGGWDDLGEAMERRFTAAVALDQHTIISSLRLWVNGGAGGGLIEMRTSDDQGRTWSDWEAEDLGAEGEYDTIPEWRALGMFGMPGFIAEFRVSDAVPFRLSAVKVNDPGGGRG